jgi:hypothetical protein
MRIRYSVRRPRVIAALVMFIASGITTQLLAQPRPIAIPPGTVIAIRTIDQVDSENADPSREYRASVDDSVVIGGVTVAPVGSPALLRLFQVQQAGAVRGQTSVTLRLVAVEIDGRRVALETGDATISSNSQTGSVVKKGGVGAAIGAGIGALRDGKSGAAKGAAIGGAAGATLAIVMGQRVNVPSETRLSFTLSQASPLPQNAAQAPFGAGGIR